MDTEEAAQILAKSTLERAHGYKEAIDEINKAIMGGLPLPVRNRAIQILEEKHNEIKIN